MDIPLVIDEIQLSESFTTELIGVFHQVNNVLPENQKLACLDFSTPVSEAFEIMKRRKFSQIPILAGNQTMGLFSYRSFAQKIDEYNGECIDLEKLRVGDFIEETHFLDVLDDWTKFLDELEEKDVFLVGNRSNIDGLISSIDVIMYLYQITSPFILIGEIERAVRRIIDVCISKEKIPELAKRTLNQLHKPDEIPLSLKEMTFNDYIQIIGYGESWHFFESTFGSNRLHRNRTRTKLEEVRELRNDVFHFRRELDPDDIQKLRDYRHWIKNQLTACLANWRSTNNG